ncbi:MAG TPA: LamG-like jellyroll fold domain-containing protein [Balneolales bacterium]|nr:LamG-like jellyroll fold domain-containing protein [Balneolales bacterium]
MKIFKVCSLFSALFCFITGISNAQLNPQWSWMKGSDFALSTGNYGTKGVASVSNEPRAREKAMTWSGPDGNLWMFGGYFNDNSYITYGYMNDLWKYNPDTDEWTWVSGSDAVKWHGSSGNYGTRGVEAASNMPSARESSTAWVGPNGNLWLMGGQGIDSNGNGGLLNDLWRYNPQNNEWTWISGSNTKYPMGNYGTKGVASYSNMPGNRKAAFSWTGPNGKLWLMGGDEYNSSGDDWILNDLWCYDVSSGQWTWVSGTNLKNQAGDFGTKGVSDSNNMPSARYSAVSWVGPEGDLWLMGGAGLDASDTYGQLNDLWKYDIDSGEWTWMSGSNATNQSDNYGTKGVIASSNVPGARYDAMGWTGPDGMLWLMRGFEGVGYPSDLWKYNPYSGLWTWVGGSDTGSQKGVYGTKGVSDASNIPGARYDGVTWEGPDGHLWLFGGYGKDANSNWAELNDLWRLDFDPGMFSLDGSNSYGKITDANELDVASAMTLDAWVKFNDVNRSTSGQEWMTLIMKGDVDVSAAYGLMVNTSSSNKTLRFIHNSVGSGYTDYNWTSVAPDTWYHVAATYDGSTAKIYIDGVQKISASAGGTLPNTTDTLYIGQNGAGNYRLDGLIGEIRLWSQSLTQQEIRDNMNMAISGNESGLAGSWLSRSGGIYSSMDITGSGNNMVSVNANYSDDIPPVKTAVSGSEGWRFLAAPGDSTTYSELLSPLWTQGFTGADASGGTSNVYYYDEISHSWKVPSNASNVIGTASNTGNGIGKGVLMYVFADDNNDGTNDSFPKSLQLNVFGKTPPVQIPLSYTDTGNNTADGWHLVANPYPVAISWQQVIDNGGNKNLSDYVYIWDNEYNSGAGGYRVYYPSGGNFDGQIPAFQSFWVKAEGSSASLRLNASDFTNNSSLYKQTDTEISIPLLKISMQGEGFMDEASVMFPADTSKVIAPVPKLQSLSDHHANLYLISSKQQRWIVRDFINDRSDEEWDIPLDVDITVGGSYKLQWNLQNIPQDWQLILKNNETDEKINLRENKATDFTVQASNAGQKGSKLPPSPRSTYSDTVQTSKFTLYISTHSLTAVQKQATVPGTVRLLQNYPNPFNPTTRIAFDVPKKSEVSLKVYDMLGRKVATLVNQDKAAGHYTLNFDARHLSSGVYIYRLQEGNKVISKKMTLIK